MGIRDGIKDAWDDVLSPLFDEFASDVSIEVLNKDTTVKDDLYDEAAEAKRYLPPLVVKGRVKIAKERLVLPGGELKDIEGKAMFKTEDLKANGIDVDFSTRITFKGKSYSVVHIEETSGVGDEYLLMKVFLGAAS
jgi:hypothetical protein